MPKGCWQEDGCGQFRSPPRARALKPWAPGTSRRKCPFPWKDAEPGRVEDSERVGWEGPPLASPSVSLCTRQPGSPSTPGEPDVWGGSRREGPAQAWPLPQLGEAAPPTLSGPLPKAIPLQVHPTLVSRPSLRSNMPLPLHCPHVRAQRGWSSRPAAAQPGPSLGRAASIHRQTPRLPTPNAHLLVPSLRPPGFMRHLLCTGMGVLVTHAVGSTSPIRSAQRLLWSEWTRQ